MRVVLPLRKNVLTPLAKGVLIRLGLMAAGSTTDKSYSKYSLWIGHDYTDNFKRRNERYHGNNQISWITWFIE